MTKQPPSHFSLSDWRKALTENTHPLWTLTTAEVEALVSRIEEAERLLTQTEDLLSVHHTDRPYVIAWLADLERAK